MTVMGLQVTPTRAVRLPTSTPKSVNRPVRALVRLLESWVLLQHWIEPVLHWLLGPEPPVGVAAARVAIVAMVVKAASLYCMLVVLEGLERILRIV